jgi:hypothetical protein
MHTRTFMNFQVQNPDWCHALGQTLAKPAFILCGRTYKIVGQDVRCLPDASTCKKVMVFALAILLLPVTLAAFVMGGLLLRCSDSHKRAYVDVALLKVRPRSFHDGSVELRQIRQEDLARYQGLFNNATAMARYAGGPRDITPRFQKWLDRWREHPFSALAVEDRVTRSVVGHIIAGHGSYEGNLQKGYSEMAGVGDPAYWNADFRNEAEGVGTAGRRHLGLEAARFCVMYAKGLKKFSLPVPCNVSAEQRSEVEAAARQNPNLKVHRNAEGQIDWIYLPFTELRATARRDNVASHRILEQVFVRENGGWMREKDAERDLFVINM